VAYIPSIEAFKRAAFDMLDRRGVNWKGREIEMELPMDFVDELNEHC
jgi:hypothetical protein